MVEGKNATRARQLNAFHCLVLLFIFLSSFFNTYTKLHEILILIVSIKRHILWQLMNRFLSFSHFSSISHWIALNKSWCIATSGNLIHFRWLNQFQGTNSRDTIPRQKSIAPILTRLWHFVIVTAALYNISRTHKIQSVSEFPKERLS